MENSLKEKKMETKECFAQEQMVFSDRIKDIVKEIWNSKIKVVSFDIFDTLLLRPVLVPTDLFRLLENRLDIPNFHHMRIVAENEARKHKCVCVQDITFDDIYEEYTKLYHITGAEKENLKNEELKIEYQTLYERKTAKYLYEQAKLAGKKIIIISDMYLPGDFLNRVLKKNGYDVHERLYVSCETGVLKGTKLMYQFVLKDLKSQGVEAREVLHIGDNKRVDVDCALASGINAIHLPKVTDISNECIRLKRVTNFILPDSLNTNNSMLYGIMLNLYFDDPFIEFDKGSCFDGSAKFMGYWFAPFMMGFIKWMIERLEKNGIEQLLWIWRDGYLPSKIFQIMRPYFTNRKIEEKKVYMGREFRLPFAALESNGFFNTFIDNPLNEKCSVDYFIKNRLLCKGNAEQYGEILSIFMANGYLNEEAEIGKFEKYRGFLNELEPYFIKNAKEKIPCYRKYLEGIIDKNRKVAIFDRSLRGKSPRFLSTHFGINSVCFTSETFDTPRAKVEDINASVEFYLQYGRYYMNRLEGIWMMLIEIIISDRMPGFKDIKDNFDGTCSVILHGVNDKEIVQKSDEIIKEIQNAIINFTYIFTKTVGEYMPYMVIERSGIFDYLIEALINPHKRDAGLIAGIYPGTSNLEPISENVFTNWYGRKIRENAAVKLKKRPWDYIRHAGYVTAEKMGILLPARTLYRKLIGDPLEPVISFDKLHSAIDRQIDYVNTLNFANSNVVLLGSLPQEVNAYFNKLSKLNSKLHYIFVASGFIKVPSWLDFPCIAGPEIFSFWGIEGQELKIHIPKEVYKFVHEKEYLMDLVKRRVLRGYSESVATALAYEAERYFTVLIERINPLLIMVWNNWGCNSVVPAEIARKKGISTISVERGFLEGTMMFSVEGYGKDAININPEKFCSLPISVNELEKAKKVIKFLRETQFNRYAQVAGNDTVQFKKWATSRKSKILLVGAFDFENPSFPQSDRTKEMYNPFFETSRKALIYIAKLSKRNDWELLYKPHPLFERIDRSKKGNKETDAFYARNINVNDLIDLADVVICMVSGVSYISLIREKPIVALAYTPLKGKGCCYEPKSKRDIEVQIKMAIKYGISDNQKKLFIKHIAQVNKYYYFDDLGNRPLRYGRPIEEISNFLNVIIKSKEEDKNEGGSMDTNKIE